MKKYLSIFLVLIIMLVIFLFSSQRGVQSHLLSDKIGNSTLILSIVETIDSRIDVSIRNIAHIFLYLSLGIIVHSTMNELLKFSKYNKSRIPDQKRRLLYTRIKLYQLRIGVISSAICLLYACSDEIHQYFVPGREACLKDIGFDAIGFVSGIALMSLIFLKKNLNKQIKK